MPPDQSTGLIEAMQSLIGGAITRDLSSTMWGRLRYLHRFPAGEVGDMTLRLSTTDGPVEIAAVDLREVLG